ncbi:MAG: hypothetical protein ACE5HS_23345 [bacterium]
MKTQYLCLIAGALTLFVWQKALLAGAWVQPKRGFYFKLSSNYLLTTKEFNHEGKRLDIFQERIIYEDASFRDFAVTAYLEYGLFENLTIVAKLPFKIQTSKRTEIIREALLARIVTVHTEGLSNLSLFGRLALFEKPLVLSVQSGVKIPLGFETAPANDGPPLDTGDTDFEANLQMGKSLYPLPAYVTASVGYKYRTGALHDQVLFTAEAGYTLGRFLLKINYDGLKSTIAPPDIVGQPVTTPLPGGGGALPSIIIGDQDIFKISPSIIFQITKSLSIQGEILHIYGGKNTVAGTAYSLGLILQSTR